MRNPIILVFIMGLGLSILKTVAQPTTKLDPSTQIEGTYQVMRMTFFTKGKAPKVANFNQTGTKISAVITAKRKSQRYVSLTLNQFRNETQMLSFHYGDAYLRTASKGYDLAIDGNKVGKTDGHELVIDRVDVDKGGKTTGRTIIVCKRS